MKTIRSELLGFCSGVSRAMKSALDALGAEDGMQKPKKIFKQEETKLKEKGFKIIEKVKLEPYEKDHLAFLVEKNF